ncbi:hypothetical protein ACFY7Y_00480 [Streptomyces virginiae]|uniref:hypothetical protein n=1 Tax=Streptomyces virginiae TaxID=1961 RepID=UPI0036A32E98
MDAGAALVTPADTTYAVEPSAGTVRWKKPDFRAVTLTDGVVAGGERTGFGAGRLLGLAAATGEQRWTVAEARQAGRRRAPAAERDPQGQDLRRGCRHR